MIRATFPPFESVSKPVDDIFIAETLRKAMAMIQPLQDRSRDMDPEINRLLNRIALLEAKARYGRGSRS
jgi:hypothetical protein